MLISRRKPLTVSIANCSSRGVTGKKTNVLMACIAIGFQIVKPRLKRHWPISTPILDKRKQPCLQLEYASRASQASRSCDTCDVSPITHALTGVSGVHNA